ncbi:hypothetical protein COF07_11885 [Bacillus wiedmannii]|uniref:cupin domain-containing protein n=1 Tax=Bacillus wiedmannii TaxID=1890302 RepID=UPI000BFE9557|nr:cupin domain-containing protein [Bacillus wiedmannii]PHA57810.1 hypothetical protein COF07_11885 [Bacillus wiedmannii]
MKIEIPIQMSGVLAQLGTHDEYPWVSLPWKGVENKVLFFDPLTGATFDLIKFKPGSQVPAHYHPTPQTIFVVKGRLRTSKGIFEEGTFNVYPAGEMHGPLIADEEEAIIFEYWNSTPVFIMKDGSTYINRVDGYPMFAGNLDFTKHLNEHNFITPDSAYYGHST